MNTKLILTISAVLYGVTGLVLTFLPEELLGYFQFDNSKPQQLFLQILGSFYFSFALMNWMVKSGKIGGIYNRPIATANFAHCLMVALATIKVLTSTTLLPVSFWFVAVLYAIFAALFALMLFWHPGSE